jgi:YD repeat-containing protein
VHTAKTTNTYDDDGHLTSVTVADPTGGDASRTVTTAYNDHGQAASSTDAAGATTTFGYDAYGNKTTTVDPAGTETDTSYDPNHRPLTSTLKGFTGDPANPGTPTDLVVSSHAYDPAGRLASVTDAMGWITAYTYTDNGLVSTVTRTDPTTDPARSFVKQANSYDAAGHLTQQKTNNNATVTTYTVDTAGRTTATTLDPGHVARTTRYTFSADDTVLTTTRTDPSGASEIVDATYDPLGRPTSQTVHNGTALLKTVWTLDKRGLPTAETDPNGNATGYAYDKAGRLAVTTAPTVSTETGGGAPVAVHPVSMVGYDTLVRVPKHPTRTAMSPPTATTRTAG